VNHLFEREEKIALLLGYYAYLKLVKFQNMYDRELIADYIKLVKNKQKGPSVVKKNCSIL